MRTLPFMLLALGWLLHPAVCCAQEPLRFLIDEPYAVIQAQLASVADLTILSQDQHKIAVCQGDMFATYYFDAGKLSKTELTQRYSTLKEVEDAYNRCMDYLLEAKAIPVEYAEDTKRSRLVALIDQVEIEKETTNRTIYRLDYCKDPTQCLAVQFSLSYMALPYLDFDED